MKILLTGATGFIGRPLLDRLIAAGHSVTAIVRSQPASLTVTDAGATGVIGDLYDSAWLAAELSLHDGAIHLAEPSDGTAAQLNTAVVDAAIKAFGGTDKPFVFTGGIWAYGDNAGIAEDSPIRPAPISAWRTEIEQRLLASDVKTSLVEPGIVYGYGKGIPRLIADAPRSDDGELILIGSGDQHWTTIHVDDLADLYVAVLAKAKGHERFVAVSGENPTVRELGEAVSDTVVAEDPDATRTRLGAGFADALMLNQQARGETVRQRFGWRPSRPTLVEELRAGYADTTSA